MYIICVYIYIYRDIYIYIYVCVCVYIYDAIYIYIYMWHFSFRYLCINYAVVYVYNIRKNIPSAWVCKGDSCLVTLSWGWSISGAAWFFSLKQMLNVCFACWSRGMFLLLKSDYDYCVASLLWVRHIVEVYAIHVWVKSV